MNDKTNSTNSDQQPIVEKIHELYIKRNALLEQRKQAEDIIIADIGKDNWRAFKDGVCMMGDLSIIIDSIRSIISDYEDEPDANDDADCYVMRLLAGENSDYSDTISKITAAYPEVAKQTTAEMVLKTLEATAAWLDQENLKLINGDDSNSYRKWREYCKYGTEAAHIKIKMNSASGMVTAFRNIFHT